MIFLSCQTEYELFDEVNQIAEIDTRYNLTSIKSGIEGSFLAPLNEYSIYKLDSNEFENLKHFIVTSEKFEQDNYYMNMILNDYIFRNNLEILNMSKSVIRKKGHPKTRYYVYLLSDRRTITICKTHHS